MTPGRVSPARAGQLDARSAHASFGGFASSALAPAGRFRWITTDLASGPAFTGLVAWPVPLPFLLTVTARWISFGGMSPPSGVYLKCGPPGSAAEQESAWTWAT